MFFSNYDLKDFSKEKIIRNLIFNLDYKKWALIVPTNRFMRYLKKEAIDLNPNNVAYDLNIYSLRTFIMKLVTGLGSYQPLSEAASQVFIAYSVRKAFKENKLEYFKQYGENLPFSLLEKLRKIFAEYKRLGIFSRELKDLAERLSPNEKRKTIEIAEIFNIYDMLCKKSKAIELGDGYRILLKDYPQKFSSNFRKIFPDLEYIYIIEFNDFSDPEIEIIKELGKIEKLKLTVELDCLETSEFYKNSYDHINSIIEKFQKNYFITYANEFSKDKGIEIERVYLNYYKNDQSFSLKILSSEDVKIYSARNKREETELIAKLIKKIIIEDGAEISNICVLFNNIEEYSDLIRDAFEKYKIPLNLTDRKSLSQINIINQLISFLEIKKRDFFYKDILRAFSGSLLANDEIDIAAIKFAANELKIVSGYSLWENKLKGAIKRSDENDEDFNYSEKKEIFERALKSLKKIKELLSCFREYMKPEDFFKAFVDIVNKFNLPQTIFKEVKSEELKEIYFKAISLALDSIKEILELLDIIEQEERNREKEFQFYVDLLKNAFLSARFNARERINKGILATNLNEARGLKFDYVFIGGLYDGNLPLRYSPEIFLVELFRTSEQKHHYLERLMFIRAAASFGKKLFLVYPKYEDARELSKSLFLREFEKAFRLKEEDCIESLKPFIFSEEEKQTHDAKIFSRNATISDKEAIKKLDIAKDKKNGKSKDWDAILSVEQHPVIKKKLTDLLENETLSPRWLEVYAACPFKFFVEKIMKIKPIEEPTEELEAIEIGLVLHEILELFYKKMIEKKSFSVYDICNENSNVKKILENIAIEVFEEKYGIDLNSSDVSQDWIYAISFYEIEKIIGKENNRMKNCILSEFLKTEAENFRNNIKMKPLMTEKKFGSRDEQSDLKEFKFGDVRIQGKIDRIDFDEETKYFQIVDYKLGAKKVSLKDIEEGLFLQTTIYAAAAMEILKNKINNNDVKPLNAKIFSLKLSEDFGYNEVKTLYKRKIENEENAMANLNLINKTKEKVKELATLISNGEFKLSKLTNRSEKVCKYCSFDGICRVEN